MQSTYQSSSQTTGSDPNLYQNPTTLSSSPAYAPYQQQQQQQQLPAQTSYSSPVVTTTLHPSQGFYSQPQGFAGQGGYSQQQSMFVNGEGLPQQSTFVSGGFPQQQSTFVSGGGLSQQPTFVSGGGFTRQSNYGTGIPTALPASGLQANQEISLAQSRISEIELKKRILDNNHELQLKYADMESDKEKKLEQKADKQRKKAAQWKAKGTSSFVSRHEAKSEKLEKQAHIHHMASENYKMAAKQIENERKMYDPPVERKAPLKSGPAPALDKKVVDEKKPNADASGADKPRPAPTVVTSGAPDGSGVRSTQYGRVRGTQDGSGVRGTEDGSGVTQNPLPASTTQTQTQTDVVNMEKRAYVDSSIPSSNQNQAPIGTGSF